MEHRDPRSDLIAAYIDGRASADDIQRLERFLRADFEFRRLFLEHLNIDGELGEFASNPVDVTEVPVRIPPGRLLPQIVPRLVVAACVAVAASVFLLPLVLLSPDTATRIEVVDSTQGSGYSTGQLLGEPRVSIDRGRITLQLDDGPTLDLSAPADVEVVNGTHVLVHGVM